MLLWHLSLPSNTRPMHGVFRLGLSVREIEDTRDDDVRENGMQSKGHEPKGQEDEGGLDSSQERYLGDSVSVSAVLDDGFTVVELTREFSDGNTHTIRLDSAVLSEFIVWLDDVGLLKLDPKTWTLR